MIRKYSRWTSAAIDTGVGDVGKEIRFSLGRDGTRAQPRRSHLTAEGR